MELYRHSYVRFACFVSVVCLRLLYVVEIKARLQLPFFKGNHVIPKLASLSVQAVILDSAVTISPRCLWCGEKLILM